MKMMNNDDYNNLIPNFDETNISNMDEKNKTSFFFYTTLYYNLLTQYLIKKTKIREFDKKIEDSGLSFIAINDEEKDVYQKMNNNLLKYIYLRNSVHILHMGNDKLQEFFKLCQKSNNQYSDELEKFIEETYKQVISENEKYNNYDISYGPQNGSFFVTNGKMVIGIRYDDFNSNGLDDDQWAENYDKQLVLIGEIRDEVKEDIENSLNIECEVFQYNDFSIITLYDLKRNKKNEL